MGRRLLSLEEGRTGFSPFIDVAINGMAAMFIFLVIYVAVVRPHPIPPLRILTESLPRGIWMQPYETQIVVTGGQPPYEYQISDTLAEELAALGLDLDASTGRIAGTPRMDSLQPMEKGHAIRVMYGVTDQARRRIEPENPLKLHIAPIQVPFDPETDLLEFAVQEMRLPDAIIGRPYTAAVGALGGLEPYQITLAPDHRQAAEGQPSGLPPGLTIEPAAGRIEGVPAQTAVPANALYQSYSIRLKLVDQQSAKLPEAKRRPRVEGRFELRVHRVEKITVTGPFPSSGRAGLEYRGALVAAGGYGKHRWEAGPPTAEAPETNFSELSELGLKLKPETGVLQGRLTTGLTPNNRPRKITIPLIVHDEEANTPAHETQVELLVLPPMQFLKPE